METIVTIAFIGIIYSVVYIFKSVTSKDAGVEGKPITGEVFPTIEVIEDEPVVMPREIERETGWQPSRERVHAVTAIPHPVAQNSIVEAKKKENKLTLKGKSDARKAFIYSEIFKRKY